MTIVPTYKICLKCRKMYSWNPSVGKFVCPHCGGLGRGAVRVLDAILKGKKKDK